MVFPEFLGRKVFKPAALAIAALGSGGVFLHFQKEIFEEKSQKAKYLELFQGSTSGKYRRPCASPTLIDLSHAVALQSGVSESRIPTVLRKEKVQELRKHFEKTQNFVFVLVDGMGNSTLREHLDELSFLRRNNNPKTLTCSWPATTPVNLCALATGCWPGEHGAVGWRLRSKTNDGDYKVVSQPFTFQGPDKELINIDPKDFYLKDGFWKNELPITYKYVNPYPTGPMADLWGPKNINDRYQFNTYKVEDGTSQVIDIIQNANTEREPTFCCFYIDLIDKSVAYLLLCFVFSLS